MVTFSTGLTILSAGLSTLSTGLSPLKDFNWSFFYSVTFLCPGFKWRIFSGWVFYQIFCFSACFPKRFLPGLISFCLSPHLLLVFIFELPNSNSSSAYFLTLCSCFSCFACFLKIDFFRSCLFSCSLSLYSSFAFPLFSLRSCLLWSSSS